jgi:hypothetical protein
MLNFTYNAIGLLGDGFVLVAYSMLHLRKLKAESFAYSFLNAIGAALVLFSLYFAWNLPAVVIESSWVAISVYGLIQALIKRKK